ncbi:acyl-CoA dehydrogenase family protein [Myxococcota bacterium]|nr:acyl-CoA dehydrogenase family protein [Myxococcota bacterium]
MADNLYINEDLEALRTEFNRFVVNEIVPQGDNWEEQGHVPREVLQQMGTLGFLGLRHPEKFGGLGLGPLSSAVFSESLGSSTYAGFEVTVLVHTDMASPHLIHSGNDDQLERFMGPIVSGDCITAIAVTEPAAGSDVAGIQSTAKKIDGGYVLNGSKTYITNGVHADLLIVAARTEGDNPRGLSMFLVKSDNPGLSVSRALRKHGWRSSDTAELLFSDCFVEDAELLGTPHRGFYEIMKNFQNERLVLSGMAVGASQKALDITYDWTQTRKAFGGVLFDKQVIRQRLAMLQARLDASRQFLYYCGWLMEQGVDATREVSGLKAISCELVNEVMYACLQFHGGLGYMQEATIERMARDARILPIGGGATEVMLEEISKRSYR